MLLARCGRAQSLITPAAAAAREAARSRRPTSFPLSSSKAVKVEYGGAASDYAGDLLLLPFWSDKDIDVGAATIAQGWDAAFGGAHGARGVAGVQGQEGRVPRLDRALGGYRVSGKWR